MIEPQNTQADKTDLRPDVLAIRLCPPAIRPYAYLMRLDRPVGTWLLLLPGWWSIALAFPHHPDLMRAAMMFVLFGIGAVIMRGAGCIVNDLWDRDIDARVERTRTRPLASGAVTPRLALAFAGILFLLGLLILLQTNMLTIWLGLASIPFIILYPLMKRITWWPQAFLGLTFNFGALMGWAAMTGILAWPAVALYIAGFFWTLGYDTIYAHMDRDDDALIGVKSTARLFGPKKSCAAITIFYALATIVFGIALASVIPPGLALIGTSVIASSFAWQVYRFDADDAPGCLYLFRFNRVQGLIILAVIILGVIGVGI